MNLGGFEQIEAVLLALTRVLTWRRPLTWRGIWPPPASFPKVVFAFASTRAKLLAAVFDDLLTVTGGLLRSASLCRREVLLVLQRLKAIVTNCAALPDWRITRWFLRIRLPASGIRSRGLPASSSNRQPRRPSIRPVRQEFGVFLTIGSAGRIGFHPPSSLGP